MKDTVLKLLFLLLICPACQNQEFIITEEIPPVSEAVTSIVVKGIVYEENSSLKYNLTRQALPNVSVKLMFEGTVLDEINTDEAGRFDFPEQPVPLAEAYLIFEAPSFYKNVRRIDFIDHPDFNRLNTFLIRKTATAVDGDAINDMGPYIKLTAPSTGTDYQEPLVYITTVDNAIKAG